jgi:hypothetical protein
LLKHFIMKKGKAIKKALVEYAGTMAEESYQNKMDEMKHEKTEGSRTERKEKIMAKKKK